MFDEHQIALRLAADFENRSPTDRLDLLNGLALEGIARNIADDSSCALEWEIHGVRATGTDWRDFVDNWCAMARRLASS